MELKIKTYKLLLIATLTIVLSACESIQQLIIKNQEFQLATVNNNVCKRLYGDVVLFAIFVDTKYTYPWTEYDITSTLDSIRIAKCWIEGQAIKSGIPINITIACHQDKKRIICTNPILVKRDIIKFMLRILSLWQGSRIKTLRNSVSAL